MIYVQSQCTKTKLLWLWKPRRKLPSMSHNRSITLVSKR